MSKIFTISDTHFNSENIIKYCNRPFENSDQQTSEIIRRWNETVSDEDTVICCGDFIMGLADTIPIILPQLNGKIILVRGNHDTPRKLSIYEQYPEKISVKDIHYESYGGLWFIFCHFPIVHEDFADMVVRDNSEVVYIHGHVHDKTPFYSEQYHSFNVSVDVIDFTPKSLAEMHGIIKADFIAKGVWREKGSKPIAEMED